MSRATWVRGALAVALLLAVASAGRTANAQFFLPAPARAPVVPDPDGRVARQRGAGAAIGAGMGLVIPSYLLAVGASAMVFGAVARGNSFTPAQDNAFAGVMLIPGVGPLFCQLIWPQPEVFAVAFAIDAVVQLAGIATLTGGIVEYVRASSVRALPHRGVRTGPPAWTLAPLASRDARGFTLALRWD